VEKPEIRYFRLYLLYSSGDNGKHYRITEQIGTKPKERCSSQHFIPASFSAANSAEKAGEPRLRAGSNRI